MVLTLPLPHGNLSPNSRVHWRAKHRQSALARNVGYWVTRDTMQGLGTVPEYAGYTLAFFYPMKRNRDDDNASAMCKAYRDGIAQALGVDDATLVQAAAPTMAVDRKRPRLEITLLPQTEDRRQKTRGRKEHEKKRDD